MSNYNSYVNRSNRNDRTTTDNLSQDLRELYEDDLRFRSEQQSQVLPTAAGLPQPVHVRKQMNYQDRAAQGSQSQPQFSRNQVQPQKQGQESFFRNQEQRSRNTHENQTQAQSRYVGGGQSSNFSRGQDIHSRGQEGQSSMKNRGQNMYNQPPPQSSSSGHEGKKPLALAPDLVGKLQNLMNKRQSLYRGQVSENYQEPRNQRFESRGQVPSHVRPSPDTEISGQPAREQSFGDEAQDFGRRGQNNVIRGQRSHGQRYEDRVQNYERRDHHLDFRGQQYEDGDYERRDQNLEVKGKTFREQRIGEADQDYERRGQQYEGRSQDYERRDQSLEIRALSREQRIGQAAQDYERSGQQYDGRTQDYERQVQSLELRYQQSDDKSLENRGHIFDEFERREKVRGQQLQHGRLQDHDKRGQSIEIRGHESSDFRGQDLEIRQPQERPQIFDSQGQDSDSRGQQTRHDRLQDHNSRDQSHEIRGHQSSNFRGQDLEIRQSQERPEIFDRQVHDSESRGQQPLSEKLFETRRGHEYSHDRVSEKSFGDEMRSSSLDRSKCPAPPQISSNSTEVRDQEPSNPLERIYLASKRAAEAAESRDPHPQEPLQPQEYFYPQQQEVQLQQDFYPPEVQPQATLYPELQPQDLQPIKVQPPFYTEPQVLQPSKPFVKPLDDKGRGKIAPWAATKKWGQHFEVLRSEVTPKVSRWSSSSTPDKNEPRPPNKKSSKAKQTVAKKSNEVSKKSTNSNKKPEAKESKLGKITINLSKKDNKKAKNKKSSLPKKVEIKDKKTDDKLKEADLERKMSRKIRFGTEEVEKKDSVSKKSEVDNGKKEEAVEIGEKVPYKTSEVKKPVEVKEVKPSEPEMDDDIEIIEEVVPKMPSKPSEPEVISLEMKLPEPVKTDFEYEDIVDKKLLRCSACNKSASTGQEFRDHIKSHDHKKMLEKVSAMNKCAIDLLRAYIAQQEFRKVCGKQVKVSQRCEMCQLSVYGHLQKHRTSKLHLKLKTFIHPICATCDQEFQNRVEWDEHIVSAKHLALTQKTGDKVWPEYYDPLDVVNMLKLTEVKNPEVTQEVKTDVHESERVREASALALSRVAQYEIAHFDDSKIVGISFVRPVDGSYCRACKKFIVTSIEEHCRTKEHYDKFVDIVNGKKVKAFEIQCKKDEAKALQQGDVGDKRKMDEGDDDEDDSGNWKRQKKSEI